MVYMKTALHFTFLLVASFVFQGISRGEVSAAPAAIYQADGWLTAVESDGAVVIDGKGFRADSRTAVQDHRGVTTSINALSLPTFIHYEFNYGPEGPTILRLREHPPVPR